MTMNQIKLHTTCILDVPFQFYDNDFIFIVNGEEYKTSRIIADLLSPKISQNHYNDPLNNTFTINTEKRGNFQNILELSNFNQINIPNTEIPFISEIIEILGNNSIEINTFNFSDQINFSYALDQVVLHEKHEKLFSKSLNDEIDYVSSHFYEITETHEEILENLNISTLEKIFRNEKLRLESEDQLISLIDKLYSKSSKYSILYEHVNFLNVTPSKIKNFLTNFNPDELTQELWKNLSIRLQQPINNSNDFYRYYTSLEYEENKELKGIIDHLQTKYKNNFFNKINLYSSGVFESNDDDDFAPISAIQFDGDSFFKSKNEENSWLCIDFKKFRVIPKNYTIQSPNFSESGGFLKSWVIEASNDEINWKIIDEQNNCDLMRGGNSIHNFKIMNKNNEEFRFIRLRQTGPSFNGNSIINLKSIEFFGGLM